MKLEAVIRSIKASSWKNTNDVGVTDENGHFRYLATITYYPEVIEFDVVGVCTYSFLQSDFSTRRQMVAHVKRFVAGWILLNQKWCNWAITDANGTPAINFCVDGREPFWVCDSWAKALIENSDDAGEVLIEAVNIAISACVDPNVVDYSGVCLDCREVVAGVWQHDKAEVCPCCDGNRVFNTFRIAYAHMDGKLSALVSK